MSALPRALIAALAGLSLLATAPTALAAEYPARPVRLVVPFSPGGNADIVARLIGERLGEALGQQVVIDNRPGANGIIGSELVAKAVPDGHTILFTSNTHVLNPSVVKQLPFDSVKDFAPVSLVGSTPLVVVAAPGLNTSTLKDLIALAKAKPGQLNYGTTGVGSPAHLAGALMNSMAGIRMVDVPYQSSTFAMNDILGGHLQLTFPALTAALQHVRTGKLRALGITTAQRSPLAPDIPTVAEAGLPGYEASIWTGILAPAGTPQAIVAKLHAEIVRILNTPASKERFVSLGSDVLYNSPAEFRTLIETEIAKWAKVVAEAGIKPQ